MTIHTAQLTQRDQEILVSYTVNLDYDRTARRSELQTQYGLFCKCPGCANTEHEDAVEEIQQLQKQEDDAAVGEKERFQVSILLCEALENAQLTGKSAS
jgi:hypothetical protein